MDRRTFFKGSIFSGMALLLGSGQKKLFAREDEEKSSSSQTVKPFSFCVVADPHCAEKKKAGIEKYGTGIDKFFKCVRQMENLTGAKKPDFLLIVGDIHAWALKKRLDEIKIPMHVISGNHESRARKKELRDLFPSDFKKDGGEADYYTFTHNGVRFIGVCDAIGRDHIGHFCSEDIGPRGQCHWLEKQLGMPEKKKIIFAHIPPEPDEGDRYMYMAQNDTIWFNKLIKRTEPDVAFFGHLHRKTVETKTGKTRVITVRSSCWNSDKTPLGFMRVRVDDKGITTEEIMTGTYS